MVEGPDERRVGIEDGSLWDLVPKFAQPEALLVRLSWHDQLHASIQTCMHA